MTTFSLDRTVASHLLWGQANPSHRTLPGPAWNETSNRCSWPISRFINWSHFVLAFGLNTNGITQTAGLSLGLSITIFYQISLTYLNAMANDQRSPIFKPPGTLEAVRLSARTVLPIKSSSVLCPPPLQKNPNLKPLKGPLNSQPPISTWQMSLLPTVPEMRLPETRPHPPALPPPNQEAMTPNPQRDFQPPPSTRTWSKHVFPLKEVAGPEVPTRVHVPFSTSDMSQIGEKLGSFSANPTRYRKEFLRLTQAYHLTWKDLYYILNATLIPDEKERIWQAIRVHADQLYNQDSINPVADDAVPLTEPRWTHQTSNAGL